MFYLLLAIFSNWLRYSSITSHLMRLKEVFRRKPLDPSGSTSENGNEEGEADEVAKDLAMEEKLRAELATITGVDPESPKKLAANVVIENMEVDENGQAVISEGSHEELSDDTSSDAG